MKFLVFVLFFASFSYSFAQGDTLLIKLKNGATDNIAVLKIKKVVFENIPSAVQTDNPAHELKTDGNTPNPFDEQTGIEFEIALPGKVQIRIFDNSNRLVRTLECADCQPGKNILHWDCLDEFGGKAQSGVYFCRMIATGNSGNGYAAIKKLLVIK